MKKLSHSRRGFLASAVAGAGFTLGASVQSDASPILPEGFQEPPRSLPLNSSFDVIVCGAGPAGVTAAIHAARGGAKVLLLEAHGALGGVWTSSLLGFLLDFDKPGFNVELVEHLRRHNAILGDGMNWLSYHPEEMKWILEELCMSTGVSVRFHTRVVATHLDGKRLSTVITESKSGREAWSAAVFIDATGDGDVGALAGCEFEIGEAKDCPCQPMSMNALILVKDASAIQECIHSTGITAKGSNIANKAYLAEIRRAGVEPSYGSPALFPIRDNLLLTMINHEYGVNATDADAVSKATIRARSELHKIVRALRNLGGRWEGVQIVATPEQIGIRDGRRIRGRYTVQKEDLLKGSRHADAVVQATFPVDIHALSKTDKPFGNQGVRALPYDIPLRALIAKEVDGLMMAGRCISGDFIAHASYRVTGNAVAMGEAAGTVSALAALTRRAPHEISWKEGKEALAKMRQTP
ncbi:hypothetical protein VN12_23130 [Pirellula sp. SH-Sr6A]|uniref:FAD-dependent oxidoreductase n=1 Tax=Pirellula sp. SH-Sr6A TaxID=1632865 RepID=UPI00078D4B87|nr:FAD-dependent oxidoreductase [Pirellula sp. SH-Sr6A]AMV35039.1 hypothetical protein VN12_23130 [Pirellula sp. SH-Sr6A]